MPKNCYIPQPTAWNTCQSIGLQTTAYLLIVFCGSSLLRLEQPAMPISWLDSCCRRWPTGTWAVADDRRSVWHWSGSWDIISSAQRYYTTTPTRIPSSPTARNISWTRLYRHLNSPIICHYARCLYKVMWSPAEASVKNIWMNSYSSLVH